jgi:ATP-dependent Lon protease
MTGEITLRGNVLPIGGLKEKIFAAHRGGIKTIIIPHDNVKDLEDIPKNILKSLKIVDVTHTDQVLRHALVTDQVFLTTGETSPELPPEPLPEVVPAVEEPQVTQTSH